ncbi:MAG: class I SAM-dependent methyltransferase [Gaiellaceae bacterium]
MTDVWSGRAEGYRAAVEQREGEDLDLIVDWCIGAETVLDVATGGGHVARRLRAAGHDVITCDPAPGMHPDVICRAEDLPFAEASFDVVVTRIAPHHFADVQAAIGAMARVARHLVIVEDTLYTSEDVEAAERLRDPTHLQSYTEAEWRSFLAGAGLVVEDVRRVEKTHPFEAWLARTACTGDEAERVRELLAAQTSAEGESWTDTKILFRARKAAG